MRATNATELVDECLYTCTLELVKVRDTLKTGRLSQKESDTLLHRANMLYLEQLRLMTLRGETTSRMSVSVIAPGGTC